MPKETPYKTKMLGAYVPSAEFDLIDAYTERLRLENPGKRITRASTFRRLYMIGLASVGMLPGVEQAGSFDEGDEQ